MFWKKERQKDRRTLFKAIALKDRPEFGLNSPGRKGRRIFRWVGGLVEYFCLLTGLTQVSHDISHTSGARKWYKLGSYPPRETDRLGHYLA